jgi:hypothetical protein
MAGHLVLAHCIQRTNDRRDFRQPASLKPFVRSPAAAMIALSPALEGTEANPKTICSNGLRR